MDIKEQICDALILQCKQDAQKEYCRNNGTPMFVLDKCFSCSKSVWENIDLEECTNKLITGCPYCGQSFCN